MKKIFNTTIGLTLIAAVMLISGCSKPAVDGHVSSRTEAYTANGQTQNETINYTYDGQGRQILMSPSNSTNITITNNGVTTSNNFAFLTNKDYRDFGNVAFGKRSTNLPSTNLVSTGGNTTTYNYSYTYDSKGRVLQETITGNNTTDIYTYTYTTN